MASNIRVMAPIGVTLLAATDRFDVQRFAFGWILGPQAVSGTSVPKPSGVHHHERCILGLNFG